eukprot:3818589-Pyramimonas_sp.AAC.1
MGVWRVARSSAFGYVGMQHASKRVHYSNTLVVAEEKEEEEEEEKDKKVEAEKGVLGQKFLGEDGRRRQP